MPRERRGPEPGTTELDLVKTEPQPDPDDPTGRANLAVRLGALGRLRWEGSHSPSPALIFVVGAFVAGVIAAATPLAAWLAHGSSVVAICGFGLAGTVVLATTTCAFVLLRRPADTESVGISPRRTSRPAMRSKPGRRTGRRR
jgi:hypothetical protein